MADAEVISIHGRDVEVKQLNETQKMLVVRQAQILRSPRQGTDAKFQAVDTVFKIIESAIVDDEDREYFMDLAATGQLEFGEMLTIAASFEDTEPAKVVATVRRATRKR
jgi:hypothetical protein